MHLKNLTKSETHFQFVFVEFLFAIFVKKKITPVFIGHTLWDECDFLGDFHSASLFDKFEQFTNNQINNKQTNLIRMINRTSEPIWDYSHSIKKI